jgi:DNA-binding NarL/FixJ family response regulator
MTFGSGNLDLRRRAAVVAARKTRVLVVDDDDGFSRFLAALLHSAGYGVVTAASADEAIAASRQARMDAAVVDVVMPGRGGYSICRELREEVDADLPVIFISGDRVDPIDRAAGILAGGDDYLIKPVHPEELLARLDRLLARSRGRALKPALELTEREIEILQLIAEGCPPGEVARRLFIAPKTVSSHVQRIFVKLGVHTRAQAVAMAYAAGLIHVGPASDEVEAHAVELLSTSVPSARTS